MIRIKKKVLADALSTVVKACSNKAHDPLVLRGIRVQFTGETLSLFATDNSAVSCRLTGIPVARHDDEKFDYVLDGGVLAQFVKACPTKEITIKRGKLGNRCQIIGKARAEMNALAGDEFPLLSLADFENPISILEPPASQFFQALTHVTGPISNIENVALESVGGTMLVYFDGRFYATNGPNLVRSGVFGTSDPIAFSSKVADMFMKFSGEGQIQVIRGGDRILFRMGALDVIGIGYVYPTSAGTLDTIIDKTQKNCIWKMSFDRLEMIEAIKRIRMFSGEERAMTIAASGKKYKIRVVATSTKTGDTAAENLQGTLTKKGKETEKSLRILIDHSSMLAALECLSTDVVEMNLTADKLRVYFGERDSKQNPPCHDFAYVATVMRRH